MTFLLLLPTVLSFLILAAHWLRQGSVPLALASVTLCGLLVPPARWAARCVQVLLVLACLEWVRTAWAIAQERMAEEQPWRRAAAILLGVACLNLVAAALFQTRRLRKRYSPSAQQPGPDAA